MKNQETVSNIRLEERINAMQKEMTRVADHVQKVDIDHQKTRTDLAVLSAKVALYSAMGAVLGGIAVNVVAMILKAWHP